jgi:hypothetical protein
VGEKKARDKKYVLVGYILMILNFLIVMSTKLGSFGNFSFLFLVPAGFIFFLLLLHWQRARSSAHFIQLQKKYPKDVYIVFSSLEYATFFAKINPHLQNHVRHGSTTLISLTGL